MKKKPDIPKLSLVSNPETKQGAHRNDCTTDPPRSAKRKLRYRTIQEAPYSRALGRPSRSGGKHSPIDWIEKAENDGRFNATYTAAKALPQWAGMEMILDQCFNEIHIFNQTNLGLIYSNEQARHNLQYSQDELDQLTIADIQPAYSVEAYARLFEPLRWGSHTQITLETTQQRRDGTLYLVEARIRSWRTESGQVFVSITNEITNRIEAQAALRAEKLAEVTLESIGDAIITVDARGRIIYCNRMAEQLTGWSIPEAMGQRLDAVFFIVNEETRKLGSLPFAKMLRQSDATRLADHMLLKSRDGQEYAIEGSIAPIHTRGGADAVVAVVFRDDTQRRKRIRRLSYEASHDSLTGLVNRRAFIHQAGMLLDNTKGTHKHHALMFIDLDRFKVVNDLYGHLVGDDLLCRIASLIADKAREADTVARLGGDEFAVLLEGCPVDQAQRFAMSLIKAVPDLFLNGQQENLAVSISIGLVSITEHSSDLKSLLRGADTACYAAKKKGGNRMQLFELTDSEELYPAHGEETTREHDAMNAKLHELLDGKPKKSLRW